MNSPENTAASQHVEQVDNGVESGSTTPMTVMDYATAVESIGSGRFMSRFREEGRRVFASLYGAPFFAITQLVPESKGSPTISLLIADSIGSLAADSGRWLSLYAKTLVTGGKFSCTVCVNARPRTLKAPKPILLQPPQQILVQNWARHLRDLDAQPDILILYVPYRFDEIASMVEDLCELTRGQKTLLSCHSRAEAVIVQHLLRARGLRASEILGFDLSKDEAQEFSAGAWWISAGIAAPEKMRPLDRGSSDSLRVAYECFQGFMKLAGDRTEAARIAALYGTRTTENVGDDAEVSAVRLGPTGGIDIATGRMFSAKDGNLSEKGEFVWEQKTLGANLLMLAPGYDPILSDDENRLLLMAWLGKVLTVSRGQKVVAAPIEAAKVQELTDIAQVSDKDAPPAAEPDDSTDRENAEPPSPATKPRLHRSRLSRSAGTVNVLALAARLGQIDQEPDNAFDSAKSRILKWLKEKGFTDLKPTGNSHIELPNGEVSIETDGKSVWSMRFDDRQQMEEGAFWRVEATLLGRPEPAIGLRLVQIRRTEDARDPVSGVPRVVASIAKEVGLHDAGIPLRSTALRIHGEQGAKWLINLLLNPNRTQPIITVSSTDNAGVDASIDRLAARLAGVAHVVCIEGAISDRMIRTFGRERSLFGNAIRLYRPGFTETSDPFQHRIWTLREKQLPPWIADDISEEACAISLEVGDVDERVPSFHAIRNLLSERRLESLRKQSQSIASTAEEERNRQKGIRSELESALGKYKSQSEELAARVHQLQVDLLATRRERDTALDEARQLKRQLDNRWTLDDVQDVEIEDESHYPDTWDDLETWVELYGEDKLVLLPQASKAARESPFKDIPLAYKALEFLVRHYVPMRTRSNEDEDTKRNHDQALAELGLDLSPVGTAADERRYKKEYRRQHEGREVKLDMHLKKGAGFDPAVIFRLYFHYDADAATVIVGHLPTHLTNRTTHSG